MKAKLPTLRQFQADFRTEEICLDHLMSQRFGMEHECGSCARLAKFYRVKARRSYACEWCGFQVFPTSNTPFDRTRTPLRDWFYVMFLFTTTRNGVAAKRVERELGVTYKTAWRMCHQIRAYMASLDGDDPLGGPGEVVEIDESYVGGAQRGKGMYREGKTLVIGFMEREGELMTKVVPNNRKTTLLPEITANVLPGSTVHTDELMTYRNLRNMGFQHHTTNQSRKQYVGATGGHVQTVEGFWAMLKRGIKWGAYPCQSEASSRYLGELSIAGTSGRFRT